MPVYVPLRQESDVVEYYSDGKYKVVHWVDGTITGHEAFNSEKAKWKNAPLKKRWQKVEQFKNGREADQWYNSRGTSVAHLHRSTYSD